jgi:hypothetical protein
MVSIVKSAGCGPVLAHRPGPELLRLTPRTKDRLLFPGLPWVARAQQEHDITAECLRYRGVGVLYVMELVQDVLESPRPGPRRSSPCSARRTSVNGSAPTWAVIWRAWIRRSWRARWLWG